LHHPGHIQSNRRSKLMLLSLFTHSIPEGIAIGVGFATGEAAFGIVLAVAIAVHNIPEGTAMSLPLRDEGASLLHCIWYSVLSSLPQAVLALPAFLLVNWFRVLLPTALAFAGGAMIYLVITELLPEAYESGAKRSAVGWAFVGGLVTMMMLTVWIEQFAMSG
jgi:zinc transporter, ZIP family